MFALVRSTINLLKKNTIGPNLNASFHIFAKPTNDSSKILTPFVPSLVQNCGFKVKGLVRKRCKDCKMIRREERWYILCKTHPRHKQMSVVKDPKNTWVLSHATQGKVRPW